MLFFRVKCINICVHDEGNPYWVAEQHLLKFLKNFQLITLNSGLK